MPPWSNTPSGTMKAAVLTKPGASPPSACFTIQSYPKPTLPSEKWILVRVYAAGLNRAELRGRNNDRPGIPEFGPFVDEFHINPPAILGEEFVGTVEVAGKETNFRVGDKVSAWVYGGGKAHDGTYAEYTLCLAERAVKFESTLPWDVLGGIPMSMWTAYGSLFDSAETKPGSVVVVHGGTSSVGIWAILLAKDKSCTVIATTRQPGKLEKLKAAGADHALLDDDSLVANVRALYPKGVSTVFELVGPDKLEKIAFPMLARHGACVVSGILTKVWALNDFTPAMIPPTRKLCFFTSTSNEDIEGAEVVLQDVIRKVESGLFKKEVYLDKVFKLEDVGKAHEYMEENRAVGKVVITID